MNPEVTFQTCCFERNYRTVLDIDFINDIVSRHKHQFTKIVVAINNVIDIDAARGLTLALPGVECYFTGDIKADVLSHFGVTEENFKGGWDFSAAPVTGLFRCDTEYLLFQTEDCQVDSAHDWISDYIDRLNDEVIALSPLWVDHEVLNEVIHDEEQISFGYGFSDHCFLMRSDIYPEFGLHHPDNIKYPDYAGESFEKQIYSWMKVKGLHRGVIKTAKYNHNNI